MNLRFVASKILLATVGRVLPLSHHPFGRFGNCVRVRLAAGVVESLEKSVTIQRGANLHRDVRIGEGSLIGENCVISEETEIGRRVLIGPDVLVYTQNHAFDLESRTYRGMSDRVPVCIEDDVWVGARAIILPGVRIGRGSTVGAGSVVTKSVPPFSVAAGNPARVVKRLVE